MRKFSFVLWSLALAGCSIFQGSTPVQSPPVVTPPVQQETTSTTSVNLGVEVKTPVPENVAITPPVTVPEKTPPTPEKKKAKIYVEAAGNVFIEYPDGEKLKITNGGGTTAGCKGGAKLHYQNPVLSSDEQYALLPLYCDGEEIETYIKEIATFRSKLLSKGEIKEFKWDEVNGSHFTGPNGELMKSPYQIRTYESKELGLKFKMTDPYVPDDTPGSLKFGPVLDMDGLVTHRFRFFPNFQQQTEEEMLKELGTEYFTIVPYQTKIGNFRAIIYQEGELCGAPHIQVIHQPRNFVLTPFCGSTNPEEELRYMKTVIRSAEKL